MAWMSSGFDSPWVHCDTMDLLQSFIRALQEGAVDPSLRFNPALTQSLRKSWQDLQAQGVRFDIEAAPDVTRSERDTGRGTKIVTYSGRFIYGFTKNGVFHEIPGDLSTKKERAVNEEGSVKFGIDPDGTVVFASESFAGNYFGGAEVSSHKRLLLIAFVIIMALGFGLLVFTTILQSHN